MTATVLTPAEELERATSDYLAISRGRDLYASAADHEAAEAKAWERLMAARDAQASTGS